MAHVNTNGDGNTDNAPQRAGGAALTGQLWVFTEGGDSDTRLYRINSDGTSQTTVASNGVGGAGDDQFSSSLTSDIGVDTAAGFYFAVIGSQNNDHAVLVRGQIGSAAAPTAVVTFPTNIIVNTIEVDAVNRKIYAGYQDGTVPPDGSQSGIRVYSYDAAGALTDNGFLTTAVSDDRADESGYFVLDPQDFALDSSIGRLFYTERIDGLAAGVFRLDLSNPNVHTQLVAQSQFPDGSSYFGDIEVDESTDLVYFVTHSQNPSGGGNYTAAENALWYISENASNGTATQVSLVGMPGGGAFYPADMTFDPNLRQLYIESEETNGSDTDDVIYVFQLDGAGTTATLIDSLSPGFTHSGANIEGLTFAQLPVLSGLTGTGVAAVEQAATKTTLLTGAPTVADSDGGYLTSATVRITGGTFATGETSAADDHLGYGSSGQITGTIATTNITVSWNAATETLTLSGYDTLAHYQTALAGVSYWATGDNPTNHGANTSRTITWTLNDGTPDMAGSTVNTGTTTLNISGVNDAPVNSAVTSATGAESANIAITGLQISDVDALASQTMTMTLGVSNGVLTLLTNVASGLTAGGMTGNGTASVTITGTQAAINATLAASNGLVYLGDNGFSGTDSLSVVTSDGGGSGADGVKSDSDSYAITVLGVNDAPTVGGDGTETLAATTEDVSPTTLTNTVSSLFSGQYSDTDSDAFAGVAIVANGSAAGTGQWQYWNGATWVNVGAASGAASVLLAASTAIRFAPAVDFNGPAPTLTARVVDASGGALTNGAIVATTTNGGSTVYSAGTVVLDHGVTAVNDAPVTTGGAAVALTSIGEDSAPGAGQTVSSLFSSHFSDAKDTVSGGSSANAFAGVAVTANTASATQGVYQYYDGAVWHDLPAVSTASALILDAGARVRFAPAADYSGSPPSLTVHMIEDSAGAVTTGATADLTVTGGSSQYGAAMTLGVTVTATNDAPIPTGSATLAAVDEDTAAPGGQNVSTIFGAHFTDIDGGDTLAGVAITGNAATSEGVWQYFNGAWVTIGAPTESAALALAAGTLVRFLPAANYNGTTPALTAYLIDSSGGAVTAGALLDVSVNGGQTRFSDTSLTLTTTITATNDTPVAPATATAVGATEQTAATLLGALAVSDLELDARNGGNGDYGGASFTVQRASANAADSFAFASGGSFTVSGGDLQVGGLTFATFTNSGGALTISFTSSGASATTARVNDVINHITYTNGSDAPPPSVTLNYLLDDGSPGGGQGSGPTSQAGGAVIVNIANVNDLPTGAVTITGATTEGQVLTVNTAALTDGDGLGTLHYQWQRSNGAGYDDVGTDATTYTPGDADVGKAIRVVVSYTDAKGAAETVNGVATANIAGVNDPHTGGASITGTATEDQVLTAVSTLADGDGLGTLHYDWRRDTGGGYVSIGAADQATYTLGDADVGATVQVVVSYTDGQGFSESATSAATATVANVNDLPTGAVVIAGAAVDGQTLTAGNTLADADGVGTIHYQWKAGGADIVGATNATLVLTGADVGKTISVVASYTDGHGAAESVASTTVTVGSSTPPSTTTGTVIDGAPVEVTKTANADGSVTQTTVIAPVTPSATDQTADIPLFTENGQSLLSVSAPVGFSMTVTGSDKPETAGSSLNNLITAIVAAGGNNSQTGAGGDFLSSLTSDSRILVQSVTPTVSPGAPSNTPLTFDGGPPTDGVMTALVLDVTKLPSGTVINLNNIDFVTIVGATKVGGGDGSQVVFGDNQNQYIVLGADDDILHGGGGDDTVGSKGGNDKLYGDAGDDTLFGGDGNDLMDGGVGNDTVLMGGNLKDYIFTHSGAGLLAASFEGDDTILGVETLKMVDGSTVTDLNKLVAGTTSVAVMTYAFFTGKTPTAAGLTYLLHAADTVNASDLSDAYYQAFNVDNRYINFAVNLASPQGQAHAWFETNYGALNAEQTLTKAYKEIFGVTLTNDKIQHLLYDQVGQDMTRLHYFELFAGSAEGAKAGIIGWLLAAAVLENTGRYAAANTAFLNDFADGDAKLNVDLVGVYGDGHAWGTLT